MVLACNTMFAQTNRVLVTVDWPSNSFENRLEVYDPANNLLVSICNEDECYQTTTTNPFVSEYQVTYDLGCLAIDPPVLPNYYLRLYDAVNDGWDGSASVTVNVGGTDVLVNDGSTATTTGIQVNFNVNSATLCTLPDTDLDGVIDLIDQDDDNDGILDIGEGLGLNNFNCSVPALNFFNGTYESGGVSGLGDDVGSIYRFVNALTGYDVLVEITEITNTTLLQMDDDSVDNANFLQTELEFTGIGTPGITFEFTIVDTGTTTPAATVFRIGGTTWDCDGTNALQESVRYYNPSAYGVDNPTSLTMDTYPDGAGVTAGTVTYDGFATNTILRSYFQFLNNTFTIRMQAQKSTAATTLRLFAMSFTQCDIFTYKAPTLIIVNGDDTDKDGLNNEFDLDSDNDGIPDNVEAQPTSGYIVPNGVYDVVSGIDTAYPTGITLEDTDGDNIPDIIDLDSDNDGTPDIEENGMANSITTFTDTDNDGLDNLFEGANTNDPSDVNDEIDNPSSSILPDTDADLALGGDLDYRDVIDVLIPSATVDFDGVDDHITQTSFMSGWQESTIMGWFKLDNAFTTTADIFGQGMHRIYIDAATMNPHSYVITNANNMASDGTSSLTVSTGQWYHVAASFSGTDGTSKLYLNGELVSNISTSTGTLSTNPTYAGPDFSIGRNSRLENGYFKGAIDEVRVFDMALTEDQIQRMVYQEIENNGGVIKGTEVDKDIVDIVTSATIPWTNLQAYYPMSNILTNKTVDASSHGRDADLKNILTVENQSAPMPYESDADGLWSDPNTWLNGDVWDITGVSARAVSSSTIKNWAIVRVRSNVQVPFSVRSLAMLIDSGSTLTVTGDNFIENTWYFALNGTLDLEDDSQLIQSVNSDLVTSATGRILRRQEGNADSYWYNYWSSPVGSVGSTGLTNNNGASNNANNTNFNIGMLEDGAGTPMQFTSAFDEVGKISNKWLYSFQNGLTYFDWVALTPASAIAPGVGYTQKGTGNAGMEQQYIFNGKPNNGTILIAADDVDGDSGNESQQNITLTTTLIGNPYPSALDADEFIRDNTDFANGGVNPVIQGTILLWEQWAGSSHWLAEYEGGYGYINLTETARAYQHPDIPIADQVQTQGIKTPTKFIPVGQGFFVEVVNDGNIEFNNGQRTFKSETAAESVFFRSVQSQENEVEATIAQRDGETESLMQTIKLEFGVSNGASRRFVLGFSDNTTDGFDYGYDGGLITEMPEEDMTSVYNGNSFVIQAFSALTDDKEIDLNLNASGNFTYSLDIVALKNIDPTQNIYLKDNQEGVLWDLRQGPYNFSATAGADSERFDIVFQDNTLSNDDVILEDVVVFANIQESKLYVKGLKEEVRILTLTNMLGQTVKTFKTPENSTLENGLYIGGLSSGVYLVNLTTESNIKLSKKIILE